MPRKNKRRERMSDAEQRWWRERECEEEERDTKAMEREAKRQRSDR